MRLVEARRVLGTADQWFPDLGCRIIEYPAAGSYAVAVPASESDRELWFLLTEYDVNHLEELEAIVHSPYVTRLQLTSA